jgi:outer membrane protein assembly factor BamB
MLRLRCGAGALVVVLFASFGSMALGEDWPQFRGPGRDGICKEAGLLQEWPEGGPKLLWKQAGLGRGYSSVAIVGGKLYTMGDRTPEGESESQFVQAYDLASRKELWAARIGPPHGDGGPRCTPTLDGELLYAVGTDGDLACLETATGKRVWTKNYARDFGGRMMSGWRFSESPLIDGEKVVCTPGGKEATIVALDKKTGDVVWRSAMPSLGNKGKDGAGYSSLIAAEIEGVRQYITILGRGAVGVDAKTGAFLWGYNRIANGVANIPNAIARGNHVFVTTSYETGSALLKLARDGDKFTAEEVYFLGPKEFENHHGGVVLVGDHLYGGSGRNNGTPVCVELLTGKIAWRGESPGKQSAAVLYADGRLVFRYQNGVVALLDANSKEFKVLGSFKTAVNNGPSWPHPVIHEGKLYLRDHDVLMCYDVKGK